MKKQMLFFIVLCALSGSISAQNNATERMLERYLSYVKIESQSQYPNPDDGPDVFPMQEGQKQMANTIYNEIKGFGNGVEVKMSPDYYYIYAKVPSNMKSHLKDLVGKTIVTSDGTTLTGADCKTGCAILVTLIEQMLNDKKFKHGDIYFCFSQNEDIGMAAMRMDLSYFDNKVPDMIIDVDGGDYGHSRRTHLSIQRQSCPSIQR